MAVGTRIAGLVNAATGEALPVDGATRVADGLRGAAARLGVDMPRPLARDPMADARNAEAALARAGWSGFTGWVDGDRGHRSLFGRTLADMPDLIRAAVAAGLAVAEHTYLDTTDAGIVTAKADDVEAMLAGDFPLGILADTAGSNARINAVLDALAASPAASAVTVFGSVARGKQGPGDLDTHVDATRPGDGVRWCRENMLGLASRHYGLYDPFMTTHRGLFVRSDEATGWVAATKAKAILAAVAADGVPLASVARLAATPEELAERCGVVVAPAPRP